MLAGDIHTASDPELEADRFALLRANAEIGARYSNSVSDD